jgi:cellulose synthase/poly-beta-1,6-N-acetylglucosamine synthase-like glycosyltransferase
VQLAISKKEVELPKREKSDSYKLSVVVPCYKSELFMSRTIDSILSSSLSDIQLVLVND